MKLIPDYAVQLQPLSLLSLRLGPEPALRIAAVIPLETIEPTAFFESWILAYRHIKLLFRSRPVALSDGMHCRIFRILVAPYKRVQFLTIEPPDAPAVVALS